MLTGGNRFLKKLRLLDCSDPSMMLCFNYLKVVFAILLRAELRCGFLISSLVLFVSSVLEIALVNHP